MEIHISCVLKIFVGDRFESQHKRLSLSLRLRSGYSFDLVTWLRGFHWPACCTNYIGLAVGVLITRPRSYRMVIPTAQGKSKCGFSRDISCK
jgi:hypothetical protein